MKKIIKPRLTAARKSLTVWVLAIGISTTEALPYAMEHLPMAKEVFDESTYHLIARIALGLGLIVRVAGLKVATKKEDDHE